MRTKTQSLTGLMIIMSLFFLLNTGCRKNDSNITATGKDVYTIAVISDIHYMDPRLYDTSSSALKTFLKYDQRLAVESDAIMREVVQELINAKPKPDLVLIPGDLSLDGEKVSHQSVAGFLSELTSAGIKVRVINGNHDINFKAAFEYRGSFPLFVPNIDSAYFRKNYINYGYSDALSTDPASLSYVSEPLPGLWLLSIDACKYAVSDSMQVMVSGNIRQATMTWALARLAEAAAKGKMVFGMMHHALINHYTDQNLSFSDLVVDRSSSVSDSLMNGGLKVIFTGHGHASDIVKKTSVNNFLYDIETSSTVVYPCTYRMITYIKDSALIISTIPITYNKFPVPSGQSLQDYAKQRIRNTLDTDYVTQIYYPKPYQKDTALRLTPRVRNALMAQMAGDEQILATSEYDTIESTNTWLGPGFSWMVPGFTWKTYILDFWEDLPPADNSLMIYLKSGACYKK